MLKLGSFRSRRDAVVMGENEAGYHNRPGARAEATGPSVPSAHDKPYKTHTARESSIRSDISARPPA